MQITLQRTIDLDQPIVPEVVRDAFFSTEQYAHVLELSLTRSGTAVAWTGLTVTAYAVREDGTTVLLSGTISGSVCSIELPYDCYLCPGRLTVTVNADNGDELLAICCLHFIVVRATTDTQTDPTQSFPSVQALDARVTALENGQTAAAVTGVKGDSESTYRTGQVNLTAANVGAAAASHTHPASDIQNYPNDDTKYLRGDGQWATVSGGGAVTGVKGDAESDYRTGNVNITPANIGLGNVGDYSSQTESTGVSCAQYATKTICSVTNLPAGVYMADGTVQWPSNANGYRAARLTTNSSGNAASEYDGTAQVQGTNTGYSTINVSLVFKLTSTGGIYLRAYHNVASTLTVKGSLHVVRIK